MLCLRCTSMFDGFLSCTLHCSVMLYVVIMTCHALLLRFMGSLCDMFAWRISFIWTIFSFLCTILSSMQACIMKCKLIFNWNNFTSLSPEFCFAFSVVHFSFLLYLYLFADLFLLFFALLFFCSFVCSMFLMPFSLSHLHPHHLKLLLFATSFQIKI